jgi:hypothetical protein
MKELRHYWDEQGFKHAVYEADHHGNSLIVFVREKYGEPQATFDQTYIAEIKDKNGDVIARGEGKLTRNAIQDALKNYNR